MPLVKEQHEKRFFLEQNVSFGFLRKVLAFFEKSEISCCVLINPFPMLHFSMTVRKLWLSFWGIHMVSVANESVG